MKSVPSQKLARRFSAVSILLVSFAAARAADINQTVNDSSSNDWNSAIWGGPAAAPTGGNNYFISSGTASSTNDRLNYDVSTGTTINGRVRTLAATVGFAGDSLTIGARTELLMKQQGTETSTANLILNGGMIRYSPNTGSFAFAPTLAGTLTVASESYLGIEHTANSSLTVASAVSGDGLLNIRAGSTGSPVLTVNFSGDLSGYTGDFVIGGGEKALRVNFLQDYANLSMGVTLKNSEANMLILSNDLTFGSFSFGATALGTGTYTASELNGLFSTTAFNDGGGTLTVQAIPEPSSCALLAGACVAAAGLGRRRRRDS